MEILAPFPTPQLLPLTVLSQRMYCIILRILQNRLVAASELHSHSLLLECYHPSAKLTEPPYFCTYQGTDGLSRYTEPSEDGPDLAKRLGNLRNLYSRFRPYRRELEAGGRRVRARPGDVPGSRTFPGEVSEKHEGEKVKQTLTLEGHELFTQLVSQSNLVKVGPRHGLFTSFVEVEESVIRVWKEWLARLAADDSANVPDEERILWANEARNTGLRFRVREKKYRREVPILMSVDEDLPVTYEVEFDGMYKAERTLREALLTQSRTTDSDFASCIGAGKVHDAGRQLWESCCVRVVWVTN